MFHFHDPKIFNFLFLFNDDLNELASKECPDAWE